MVTVISNINKLDAEYLKSLESSCDMMDSIIEEFGCFCLENVVKDISEHIWNNPPLSRGVYNDAFGMNRQGYIFEYIKKTNSWYRNSDNETIIRDIHKFMNEYVQDYGVVENGIKFVFKDNDYQRFLLGEIGLSSS